MADWVNCPMSNIKFNVAQLLRQEIGAQRHYTFTEAELPLDETLTLRNLVGDVHFTRTASGVYAHIIVAGVVELMCVRSLQQFDYTVNLDVVDEFHALVDVDSGVSLTKPIDDDPFFLNELHMADVGEIIREYTLLELPLRPVCDEYRDTPITYSVVSDGYADDDDTLIDTRLAILKNWGGEAGSET